MERGRGAPLASMGAKGGAASEPQRKAVVALPPEGARDELAEAIEVARHLPAAGPDDASDKEAAMKAFWTAWDALQEPGVEGLREAVKSAWLQHRILSILSEALQNREDPAGFFRPVRMVHLGGLEAGVKR